MTSTCGADLRCLCPTNMRVNFANDFFLSVLGWQDAVEYAECEALVKEHPAAIEAMKRRGIYDMDLVMVDPW